MIIKQQLIGTKVRNTRSQTKSRNGRISTESVFNESAKTVPGYKTKKSKSWITADSWEDRK